MTLAQDWLRDTGQAVPAVVASRVVRPPRQLQRHLRRPRGAQAGRYLRGVR